jgi:hypothetical protein
MSVIQNNFWLDKKGNKVHPDLIRIDEQLKSELVEQLCAKAIEKNKALKAFKVDAFSQIDAYFDLLLQRYGIDAKGHSKKGNLTFENFSGTAKVMVSVSDRLAFDEKLNVAKMKIDEYLHEITQNASADIQTLITKAFEVDKKGDVNAKKILSLKSYDIQHPKWKEAMEIIGEATQIVSSKNYIRFYQRKNIECAYALIPLDLAGV